MGYDVRFSNAGRVLAHERINIVLKVFPAPARPFFGEVSAGDDAADPIKVDLLVENPIFTARGLLFSRFTRVWEGREVRDETQWLTGPVRVVKQNWANAERISEAFLYDQAEDIPSVAKVLGSQVVEGTANLHRKIAQDDVLGVYQIVVSSAQPSQGDSDVTEKVFLFEKREETPRLYERVLVRMVFEQKGRSVFTVRDSKELLRATRQWVEGLQGLQEKRIVHRDISSGNLLLGLDPDSRAFITDLGLAHFNSIDGLTVSDSRQGKRRDTRDRPHVTGTLPFISHQILEASIEDQPLVHTFHHDLESIFWVLIHLVLQEEPSNLAKVRREALLSANLHEVLTNKQLMLSDALGKIKFSGRFRDLESFLKAFAEACWDHHKRRRNLEFQDVIKMVDRALELMPPSSWEPVARASYDKTKRKRGSESDGINHPGPVSDENEIGTHPPDDIEGGDNRYYVPVSGSRELRRGVL